MDTKPLPRNLMEAVRYFSDPQTCIDFVANLRWPDGVECPVCGSPEPGWLSSRSLWKCRNRECRKQFSVKKGTIFEDSPIGLDKWLCAIWMIANSKNGVSSHELGRSVGITQKSAWFVLHRIRLAMQIGSFDKFDGEVEVDETYVGGKIANMHPEQAEVARMQGKDHKAIVAGSLQRSEDGPSQVRARVVTGRGKTELINQVRDNVEPGSTVYTDALGLYRSLAGEYDHAAIDHAIAYVEGRITTNGIENFWALLKRGLHGTYVYANREHLHRYVDERVFTFNERGDTDLGRFRTVLSRISGRRLTYDELIGNTI